MRRGVPVSAPRGETREVPMDRKTTVVLVLLVVLAAALARPGARRRCGDGQGPARGQAVLRQEPVRARRPGLCFVPSALRRLRGPNRGQPVSEGVITGLFGGRNAPSAGDGELRRCLRELARRAPAASRRLIDRERERHGDDQSYGAQDARRRRIGGRRPRNRNMRRRCRRWSARDWRNALVEQAKGAVPQPSGDGTTANPSEVDRGRQGLQLGLAVQGGVRTRRLR